MSRIEYKVKTASGTTWNYIVSYEIWKLNNEFFRFVFNDGMELMLPIKDISVIQQIKP